MADEISEEQGQLLAWQEAMVGNRRRQLRLTKKEAARRADVSDTTWLSIEQGRSHGSEMTRLGVCRALQWTDDSFDRLLAGDAPVPLEQAELAAAGPADRTDLNSRVAALDPEDQRYIDGIIDALERKKRGG